VGAAIARALVTEAYHTLSEVNASQ
jgi:hypothetical protein